MSKNKKFIYWLLLLEKPKWWIWIRVELDPRMPTNTWVCLKLFSIQKPTGFCSASYSAMLFQHGSMMAAKWSQADPSLHYLQSSGTQQREPSLFQCPGVSSTEILVASIWNLQLFGGRQGIRAESASRQVGLELNHRLLWIKGRSLLKKKHAAQMKTVYKTGNLPINYKWLINMQKIQICYKIKK